MNGFWFFLWWIASRQSKDLRVANMNQKYPHDKVYYCPAGGKAIEKLKASPRHTSLGPVVLNAAAQ